MWAALAGGVHDRASVPTAADTAAMAAITGGVLIVASRPRPFTDRIFVIQK